MIRSNVLNFYIIFYLIWSMKELLFHLFPLLSSLSLPVKMLFWIAPVLFFLAVIDKNRKPFASMKMATDVPRGIGWAAARRSLDIVRALTELLCSRTVLVRGVYVVAKKKKDHSAKVEESLCISCQLNLYR